MQADVMTAQAAPGHVLALANSLSVDSATMRIWLIRALTVLLIIVGIALTFVIFGALGFAVYGLPASSFRRRPAVARAA